MFRTFEPNFLGIFLNHPANLHQKFAYLRLFFLFLQCVCQKMMNITKNKIDF